MTLSTPIPYAKSLSLKFPLGSASVEAGFPSPADDHLERHIKVGEDQELTIWGALTYIIHQAR